ncbi:MAG: hypothetical protein K5694_07315 [Bacilli bacterium]|nr:hypothetical protein [Bacilli bacterium]
MVKVDDDSSGSLSLRTSPSGSTEEQGVTILNAEPATNMECVTAKEVMSYMNTLYEVENLSGANNLISVETGMQQALVYTFYLANADKAAAQAFSYYVSLDSYFSPTNGAVEPYSYLRVLIFENVASSGEHNHAWYGALNSSGAGTIEDPTDLRECISSVRNEQPYDYTTPRTPIYKDGDMAYCEPFKDDSRLVEVHNRSIAPGESVRFTIVTYFEGEDPDSRKQSPKGSSLALSVHFGSEITE